MAEQGRGRNEVFARLTSETKQAFKTTEFWAMVALVVGILIASAIVGDGPMWQTPLITVLFGTTVVTGYLASGFLCTIGLIRRRLTAHAWVLAFMPLHWLLLSLAAWRALYQLIFDPYRWEKTEHGLARTSRRSGRDKANAITSEILKTPISRRDRSRAGRDRYGTTIEKLAAFENV